MDKSYASPGLVAGLTGQQTQPALPQVMDQVDQLSRYQDELDELLDRMESRLSAIMHGATPDTAKQQSQISLALVPLADGLRVRVVMTQGACARIRSMLDRIEL